ncbi:MAG: TIGR02217 family protein [Tropicimonas sp.]|uniref:phage distal tail protein, Rcc01695 family n=1 Tax=Tropicimonas sp. TaxID=2067044 RepID=UPI003A8A6F6A
MGFHETRFPTAVSFGSLGGPERRTEIVTLASGHEERNTPWAHSRRRYDAGLGVKTLDELADLIAFFEARRGRLHGFRWKDWTDCKSCPPSQQPAFSDQVIGSGDGETTDFQLVKEYVSGGESYRRPITKPVAGSVLVGRNGVALTEGADWMLDPATGIVTLAMAPADGSVITAGFEFDVPVRFDSDAIRISAVGFAAGEVPDVPVVEVRV